MAKTADQREKELTDDKIWAVFNNWEIATDEYKKDLSAPIFKSKGDIAGMAKKFDTAQSKFEENMDKKKRAGELFSKGLKDLQTIKKQTEDMQKRVDELKKESMDSVHLSDGDDVQDLLKNWEEMLKAQQDQNKESKNYHDQIDKLHENYSKSMSDTIAKVKKEIDAAKSAMNSSNAELNALESQIRAAVINYDKVAISMNKPEIAKAVRGFLHVFGK